MMSLSDDKQADVIDAFNTIIVSKMHSNKAILFFLKIGKA